MSDETTEVPQTEKQGDVSSASLVGAPPGALPEDKGGEAALVGHPEPPQTLEDTPVHGGTDDDPYGVNVPTGAEADTPDGTATGSANPDANTDPETGNTAHAVGFETPLVPGAEVPADEPVTSSELDTDTPNPPAEAPTTEG